MPAKATDQLRRASVSAAPPRTKLRGFLNALPHQLRLAIFSLALLSFLLALFPFSVDFSVPLPPRATTGHNTSFVSYLDAHFPTTSKQGLGLGLFRRKELTPHVWLTMAGEAWVDTGTAALDVFVQRLNVEREIKYGVGVKRKTVLVVLCLDAGCVAACERRGLYGYYGYEHTRPEEIFVSTWPKLASLIEVLPTRDIFFVDSDVAWKTDPYPHMEPLMLQYDLLISENFSWEHFNTGWVWFRSCPEIVEAWRDVLEMDMLAQSRDQVNLNTVLGSSDLRLWPDIYERPLRADFTAHNGMKVHVLSSSLFRCWHFRDDIPRDEIHVAYYLHMTCGDDLPTKVYVAQSEGYWTDVDDLYTLPPKVITLDTMSGPKEDLVQLMKIVLAAAHYTSRSFEPPLHAYVTGLNHDEGLEDLGVAPADAPVNPYRKMYATFPLWALSKDLAIPIVEAGYSRHASAFLLGASPVEGIDVIAGLNKTERARREMIVREMANPWELDIRTLPNLAALIEKISSPSFVNARSIKITNPSYHPPYRAAPKTAWRQWTIPALLGGVKTCARIDLQPECDRICRWEHNPRLNRTVEVMDRGRWPTLDVMSEWDL